MGSAQNDALGADLDRAPMPEGIALVPTETPPDLVRGRESHSVLRGQNGAKTAWLGASRSFWIVHLPRYASVHHNLLSSDEIRFDQELDRFVDILNLSNSTSGMP